MDKTQYIRYRNLASKLMVKFKLNPQTREELFHDALIRYLKLGTWSPKYFKLCVRSAVLNYLDLLSVRNTIEVSKELLIEPSINCFENWEVIPDINKFLPRLKGQQLETMLWVMQGNNIGDKAGATKTHIANFKHAALKMRTYLEDYA